MTEFASFPRCSPAKSFSRPTPRDCATCPPCGASSRACSRSPPAQSPPQAGVGTSTEFATEPLGVLITPDGWLIAPLIVVAIVDQTAPTPSAVKSIRSAKRRLRQRADRVRSRVPDTEGGTLAGIAGAFPGAAAAFDRATCRVRAVRPPPKRGQGAPARARKAASVSVRWIKSHCGGCRHSGARCSHALKPFDAFRIVAACKGDERSQSGGAARFPDQRRGFVDVARGSISARRAPRRHASRSGERHHGMHHVKRPGIGQIVRGPSIG